MPEHMKELSALTNQSVALMLGQQALQLASLQAELSLAHAEIVRLRQALDAHEKDAAAD